MNRYLAIVGLLSGLLWAGPAAAQCLEYEPKAVTLSGTVVRQTYPGCPNYESIARGDERETIWVLRLKKTICVLASDEVDQREDSQKEIQLVLEPRQYRRYRKLVGQTVTVTGTLFHSHTGHHHKQLLLTTSEIARDPRGHMKRRP